MLKVTDLRRANLYSHPKGDKIAEDASDQAAKTFVHHYSFLTKSEEPSLLVLVGGGDRHDYRWPSDLGIDHAEMFLFEGKPALFVSHPYGLTEEELTNTLSLCSATGLILKIGAHDWYFRGETLCVEFWEPTAFAIIHKATTQTAKLFNEMEDKYNDA